MSKFQLEGTRQVGIVVAGDADHPDPSKAGRVRIGLPHFLSPNADTSKLPWSQVSLGPSNHGGFTRPPHVGMSVSVYYPVGSKDSGRGVVDSIYNSINTFEDVNNNTSLVYKGWIKEALNKVPAMMMGFAKVVDQAATNESGAEKIIGGTDNAGKVPSIMARKGVLTSLAIPLMVQNYHKITSVATAVQEAANILSSSASIPGTLFSLSHLAAGVPEISGILNMMGEHTPLSGTNFMQTGNRVSDSGLTNVINQLKSDLTNQAYNLDEAILNAIKNVETIGVVGIENLVIQVVGPFGIILQTITSGGTLSSAVDTLISQAISSFSGLVSSIECATGTLLGNSSILTDHLNRLPLSSQATLKAAIDSIPTKLTNSIIKAKAY